MEQLSNWCIVLREIHLTTQIRNVLRNRATLVKAHALIACYTALLHVMACYTALYVIGMWLYLLHVIS